MWNILCRFQLTFTRRRYYKCLCEQKITGTAKESERYKLELLMNQAEIGRAHV